MANATESRAVPTIAAEIDGSLLTLTFSNGARIRVEALGLSEEIRHAALMHGLKQKLIDAAAISRNPETGRSATVGDKYAAVAEVEARLRNGVWNKAREGGGASGGLLLQALIRMHDGKKTAEEVKAFVDGLNAEQQAALRTNPKVAPIIAAIKAERDAGKSRGIDSDELLAGL